MTAEWFRAGLAMAFPRFDECDVCSVTFNEAEHLPKILPCAHTFCLACLLKLSPPQCPFCRASFAPHPYELETNYKIAAALQCLAGESSSIDAKRLYVGRLPPDADAGDVAAVFAPFGDVEGVRLVRNFDYGGQIHQRRQRNRYQYGFITFSDEISAEIALSSKPIFYGDKKLIVETARPKANVALSGDNNFDDYPYSHQIYVHPIPSGFSNDRLKEVFKEYGAVRSVTRTRRGAAIILFVYAHAVDKACQAERVTVPPGVELRWRRFYAPYERHGQRRQRQPEQQRPRPQPQRNTAYHQPRIRTRPDDCCAIL